MSAPRRPSGDGSPTLDQPTLPRAAAAGIAISERELAHTIPFGAAVSSEPSAVDPAPRPLSGDRYETARTLGAGGMGEVLLCRDLWLGR
ncbi:MAG: hypothetical protein HOW73_42615, partial [Polyangiaceae bacterium]|nr:hypothetical protein [Polyangiaceae bacterium]